MPYKILDSTWYNGPTGCVGIVAVETFNDEWKAYIGVCLGYNQKSDEQSVAARGCGLGPDEAIGFFPHLDKEKYKKG